MKVLLILVDGMRPDALVQMDGYKKLIENASYIMEAQTVFPSVTLPCHMSLFYGIDPDRHGTTTNTYAPQVRPVKGLCELLAENQKKMAFFYSYEGLRDLASPGCLAFSYMFSSVANGCERANNHLTDMAISYIREENPDFTFLYHEYPDAAGHKNGWMSEEYMDAMKNSIENIEKVIKTLPEDYVVIITSDHGGHERRHGTDLPEDMLIPVIFRGAPFEKNKALKDVSILDLAPTITKLFDIAPVKDWEGKSLI